MSFSFPKVLSVVALVPVDDEHILLYLRFYQKFMRLPVLGKLIIAYLRLGIKNGFHYRRDVTFHEDKTRMARKTIARAMASINNLVIALLHHHGFTNHAQARRILDAKPAAALALTCRL